MVSHQLLSIPWRSTVCLLRPRRKVPSRSTAQSGTAPARGSSRRCLSLTPLTEWIAFSVCRGQWALPRRDMPMVYWLGSCAWTPTPLRRSQPGSCFSAKPPSSDRKPGSERRRGAEADAPGPQSAELAAAPTAPSARRQYQSLVVAASKNTPKEIPGCDCGGADTCGMPRLRSSRCSLKPSTSGRRRRAPHVPGRDRVRLARHFRRLSALASVADFAWLIAGL